MISTNSRNGSPVEFITHVPKMMTNATGPANHSIPNDAWLCASHFKVWEVRWHPAVKGRWRRMHWEFRSSDPRHISEEFQRMGSPPGRSAKTKGRCNGQQCPFLGDPALDQNGGTLTGFLSWWVKPIGEVTPCLLKAQTIWLPQVDFDHCPKRWRFSEFPHWPGRWKDELSLESQLCSWLFSYLLLLIWFALKINSSWVKQ